MKLAIFLQQNNTQLIELFIWMLGSFLIGYLFSWFYFKNKYQSHLRESKQIIINLQDEMRSSIRARKTVERGGIEITQPKKLDFNSFGKANETDKDDLKKIKGVGAFLEEKLNNIGIYTYKQISNFSDEDINTVTDMIQFFPGRMLSDDWRGQAKKLLETKTT